MRTPKLAVTILLSVVAACSSKTSTPGAAPTPSSAESASSRKDPDAISRAELEGLSGVNNAFDAINRLRPRFFRETRASGPLTVRLDNALFGGKNELRNLMIADLEEIRYLNPSEATARFGTGNNGPIIVVTSKKAGKR